jgi:hypothetical protein
MPTPSDETTRDRSPVSPAQNLHDHRTQHTTCPPEDLRFNAWHTLDGLTGETPAESSNMQQQPTPPHDVDMAEHTDISASQLSEESKVENNIEDGPVMEMMSPVSAVTEGRGEKDGCVLETAALAQSTLADSHSSSPMSFEYSNVRVSHPSAGQGDVFV